MMIPTINKELHKPLDNLPIRTWALHIIPYN